MTVIADMLGVPAEDMDRFEGWSNAEALRPTLEHHERKLMERDGLMRADGRIVRRSG